MEFKFELEPEQISKLDSSPWLEELRQAAKSEKVVSVYFDTRKRRLHEKGISLRVRHTPNKRFQTIKTASGAGISRNEWEVEIEGDVPDVAKVKGTALEPLVDGKLGRKLLPAFETDVTRLVCPVEINGSHVEVAIDRGQIRTGELTRDINEVEVELKDGNLKDAPSIARKLVDGLSVRYALTSKAERGYAMLEGKDPEEVVGAESIVLTRQTSVADAFKTIAQACLRHFGRNEQAVLTRNPEGVHQMRVGLRRLRAALSLFKEMFGDAESQQIKADLRWLIGQLGPARDYDVFINGSPALKSEERLHEQAIRELESLLDHKRSEGFDQAVQVVNTERFRKIVVNVGLWLMGGDWTTDSDPLLKLRREGALLPFVRRVLTERTRKIGKKLNRLDRMDELARHRLRIRVKKLHYATQFFASLFPKAKAGRKAFIEVLKEVQDTLGGLNDHVVHERLMGELIGSGQGAGASPGASQVPFAAGLVRGAEDAEMESLLAAVAKANTRLSNLKHFW